MIVEKHNYHPVDSRIVEGIVRGIGHDIGAPVRHIVYFAQMLSEQAMDDTSFEGKQQRWLSLIHESGKQIQIMLSALSVLTRLSMLSDKTSLINLRDLFDKKWAIHKDFSVQDKERVSISFTGNWPEIEANEEHWETLFSCLLENACKFQPIEADHITQIQAHCEVIDKELIFTLEDNGLGIRESQREEVLRAFKRLHGPEDYPGLGIGLTYCDLIAELNAGSLVLDESSLGGLRVTYRQPLV